MSTTQVKPIPDGMHSITPHLICAGAADPDARAKRQTSARERANWRFNRHAHRRDA